MLEECIETLMCNSYCTIARQLDMHITENLCLYIGLSCMSDGRVRDKGMNVNDQSGRRESKRKYGHNHVRTCRSGCLSHLKKPKPPNLQWFR